MFTLQVGFMSPSFVGIVPSIEMVIFCAVGGRLSLLGAVYGALIVNWTKTAVSESFPELWLLGMGALFIGVVMAFPNGLAGLYQRFLAPYVLKWIEPRKAAKAANDVDPGDGQLPLPLDMPSAPVKPAADLKTSTSTEAFTGGVYVDPAR